jgi:hypothetical protein
VVFGFSLFAAWQCDCDGCYCCCFPRTNCSGVEGSIKIGQCSVIELKKTVSKVSAVKKKKEWTAKTRANLLQRDLLPELNQAVEVRPS